MKPRNSFGLPVVCRGRQDGLGRTETAAASVTWCRTGKMFS